MSKEEYKGAIEVSVIFHEGQRMFAVPKQPAKQEPVEYWTVADGWVSEQAEVPAAVWVEPDFWENCNRVNCGTAYRLPAPGRQPLYKSPPAQRKPLTLWTEAQHERAYRNSPELHKDVKSLAAFKRVAKEIAAMYGITGEQK